MNTVMSLQVATNKIYKHNIYYHTLYLSLLLAPESLQSVCASRSYGLNFSRPIIVTDTN